MRALKALWTVTGQMIPGEERGPNDPAKSWSYTSVEYERDCTTPEGLTVEGSNFRTMQAEAMDFALQLQLQGWNTVKLEYMWM